ncbi:MAG: hypothetical protein QNJ67_19130 [Kiloniellales bacterium]|nr:hypothetical protein [Kiloniellales bacterium]
MDARIIISASLSLLLLGACAMARTGEDRFSYTPSVSVEGADYDYCDAQARAAASRALAEVSDEAETFALMTGALGAWMSVEYGLSVEQSAYNEAFDDCLRDKGYEIGQ